MSWTRLPLLPCARQEEVSFALVRRFRGGMTGSSTQKAALRSAGSLLRPGSPWLEWSLFPLRLRDGPWASRSSA